MFPDAHNNKNKKKIDDGTFCFFKKDQNSYQLFPWHTVIYPTLVISELVIFFYFIFLFIYFSIFVSHLNNGTNTLDPCCYMIRVPPSITDFCQCKLMQLKLIIRVLRMCWTITFITNWQVFWQLEFTMSSALLWGQIIEWNQLKLKWNQMRSCFYMCWHRVVVVRDL